MDRYASISTNEERGAPDPIFPYQPEESNRPMSFNADHKLTRQLAMSLRNHAAAEENDYELYDVMQENDEAPPPGVVMTSSSSGQVDRIDEDEDDAPPPLPQKQSAVMKIGNGDITPCADNSMFKSDDDINGFVDGSGDDCHSNEGLPRVNRNRLKARTCRSISPPTPNPDLGQTA